MANTPLHRFRFYRDGGGEASTYASELLELLGAERDDRSSSVSGAGDPVAALPFPALPADLDDRPGSWASSGAMSLTGHAEHPPLDPGGPAMRRMVGAGAAAELIASVMGRSVSIDAPALLGERAALTGLSRRGRRSVGGACEILRCQDGWIALNLPRDADIELVPAWLRDAAMVDASPSALRQSLLGHTAADLVSSAQPLGLAVSAVGERSTSDATSGKHSDLAPLRISHTGADHAHRAPRRWSDDEPPVVIDLTGLWAGPLCTSLLVECGARVIKVESTARPDGARFGSRAFFDLLNGGKSSVSLDPREPADQQQLRQLIARADLVVESFRPHAMPRLGLGRDEMMSLNPGLSWLSINAYDRHGPLAERVGYGDDVAVSAGLVAIDHDGSPVFCADAVADPMSGLLAFVAALACLAGGGGHRADVCLQDVVASLTTSRGAEAPLDAEQAIERAAPPRSRPVTTRARPLGADTADVLHALGVS